MTQADEVRLLVKGIRQLKEERDVLLSNLTDRDPLCAVEKVLDIARRYDNLVCCLIACTLVDERVIK